MGQLSCRTLARTTSHFFHLPTVRLAHCEVSLPAELETIRTPIVACIVRLDLPHLKCATATREILPPILLTLFSKCFTPPLVVKWLCTSGLDWECNCLPWKNIILAQWLRSNFGRLGCKNKEGYNSLLMNEYVEPTAFSYSKIHTHY